jgi:putative peptidoglycan lipid II flippase
LNIVKGATIFRSLRRWIEKPSTRVIVIVSAISLLAGFVGFVREVLLAARFGTSRVVASFVALSGLQAVGVVVLADAVALGVATLLIRREQTRSALLRFSLAAALGVGICQYAGAHWLAAALTGDSGQLTREVTTGLRWTAAGSMGIVLSGGVGGALSAANRLRLNATLSLLSTLSCTAAIVVIKSARVAIYGGWSASMAVVAVASLVLLERNPRSWFSTTARPNFDVLIVAGPIALATLLNQSSFLIERRVGAGLGQASLASIGFGQKIAIAPSGILLSGFAAWVLPRFLRLGHNDVARLHRELVRNLRLILGLIGLPSILLIFLAAPVVHLILQHGAFTAADASTTAEVLRGYAWGLPSIGGYMLVLRAAQAIRRYRLIVVSAGAGLVTTAALVVPLTAAWGVGGVTSATSAGNWVGFGLCWLLVSRALRRERISRASNGIASRPDAGGSLTADHAAIVRDRV